MFKQDLGTENPSNYGAFNFGLSEINLCEKYLEAKNYLQIFQKQQYPAHNLKLTFLGSKSTIKSSDGLLNDTNF